MFDQVQSLYLHGRDAVIPSQQSTGARVAAGGLEMNLSGTVKKALCQPRLERIRFSDPVAATGSGGFSRRTLDVLISKASTLTSEQILNAAS